MTAEPTQPSNMDLENEGNQTYSWIHNWIPCRNGNKCSTNQLLVKIRASLYSVALTNGSSTMPVSRRVFRLQCMMTSEKTAKRAGNKIIRFKFIDYFQLELRCYSRPAKIYITPVMRTALIWRCIIPKVPSSAADASNMTQTMAQEIDKLCISIPSKRGRKKRKGKSSDYFIVPFHHLNIDAKSFSTVGLILQQAEELFYFVDI